MDTRDAAHSSTLNAMAVGAECVLDTLAETADALAVWDLSEPPPLLSQAPSASRFVEVRELGRGGLGVVLEAFGRDLRRFLALKRARADRLRVADIGALVKEAQVTAQLDHPNIPSVHSLGIDAQGQPYFTMTMVRGRSLAQILAERSQGAEFPLPRLLRIFLHIGYAVAFAHSKGVLHRDLKPDNVMVGEFGEVRLMDWGLAKILGREDAETGKPSIDVSEPGAETRPGSISGTLGYAPPEQLKGASDIDERADVYALGATLYEMVSGRKPVLGGSLVECMLKTIEGQIPPISEFVPVSKPLAAIIHRALQTERENRYPTLLAFIEDVEALLEGRSVRTLEESVLAKAGRFYMSRSPRLALLRFIDIDCVAWGCYLLVMATVAFITAGSVLWAWVMAVAGALFCAPFFYAMGRRQRADDPGVIIPFSDGLSSSQRHSNLEGANKVSAQEQHSEVPGPNSGESA